MKINAQPAARSNAAESSAPDPQAWALAYLESPEFWGEADDDWTVNGGPLRGQR